MTPEEVPKISGYIVERYVVDRHIPTGRTSGGLPSYNEYLHFDLWRDVVQYLNKSLREAWVWELGGRWSISVKSGITADMDTISIYLKSVDFERSLSEFVVVGVIRPASPTELLLEESE